jgi:hypothetical protein
MKAALLTLSLFFCSLAADAQLALTKRVGKGSDASKTGFGVFAYYDIPLQQSENRSLRIELLDLAFFPKKEVPGAMSSGYVSVKLGYKHIFSETKTGFYVEPQAGYCRVVVVDSNLDEALYGDGFAAAMEAGYSLEVGENSNTINVGVKYETDRAGKAFTLNSVGLRLSYSFNLFRRKE